ncbi:putative uncharacterized protein DDB_G0279653 [Limulus polyphemus]|uniref:Uncharacterized protein n=1 Tax=Limulus polyphemus TaxID=6850 RepID=A0ABM1C5J6_LIMPO|nr:putative uncharacterized protein DDB_G0279653 [Limulus polyphemus]
MKMDTQDHKVDGVSERQPNQNNVPKKTLTMKHAQETQSLKGNTDIVQNSRKNGEEDNAPISITIETHEEEHQSLKNNIHMLQKSSDKNAAANNNLSEESEQKHQNLKYNICVLESFRESINEDINKTRKELESLSLSAKNDGQNKSQIISKTSCLCLTNLESGSDSDEDANESNILVRAPSHKNNHTRKRNKTPYCKMQMSVNNCSITRERNLIDLDCFQDISHLWTNTDNYEQLSAGSAVSNETDLDRQLFSETIVRNQFSPESSISSGSFYQSAVTSPISEILSSSPTSDRSGSIELSEYERSIEILPSNQCSLSIPENILDFVMENEDKYSTHQKSKECENISEFKSCNGLSEQACIENLSFMTDISKVVNNTHFPNPSTSYNSLSEAVDTSSICYSKELDYNFQTFDTVYATHNCHLSQASLNYCADTAVTMPSVFPSIYNERKLSENSANSSCLFEIDHSYNIQDSNNTSNSSPFNCSLKNTDPVTSHVLSSEEQNFVLQDFNYNSIPSQKLANLHGFDDTQTLSSVLYHTQQDTDFEKNLFGVNNNSLYSISNTTEYFQNSPVINSNKSQDLFSLHTSKEPIAVKSCLSFNQENYSENSNAKTNVLFEYYEPMFQNYDLLETTSSVTPNDIIETSTPLQVPELVASKSTSQNSDITSSLPKRDNTLYNSKETNFTWSTNKNNIKPTPVESDGNKILSSRNGFSTLSFDNSLLQVPNVSGHSNDQHIFEDNIGNIINYELKGTPNAETTNIMIANMPLVICQPATKPSVRNRKILPKPSNRQNTSELHESQSPAVSRMQIYSCSDSNNGKEAKSGFNSMQKATNSLKKLRETLNLQDIHTFAKDVTKKMIHAGKNFIFKLDDNGSYIHRAIKKNELLQAYVLLEYWKKLTGIQECINEINCQDKDGRTLLHCTALSMPDKPLLAEVILDLGANISIRDITGETPIHYAACRGSKYLEILKVLIRKTGNVNLRNSKGQTPLHCAVLCHGAQHRDDRKEESEQNDKLDSCLTIKFLLKMKALLSAQDSQGQTPIHYAVRNYKSQEILKLFFEHSLECPEKAINIQDENKQVALHLAAKNSVPRSERHADLVRCLMTNGACTQMKDKNNKLPVDLVPEGNAEVQNLLQNVWTKTGWKVLV